MKIAVLSNSDQKEELSASTAGVVWLNDVSEFLEHKDADAFIDLLFQKKEEHLAVLKQVLPKPVIVNSVIDTLEELYPNLIRINGWTTFLKGAIIEGNCINDNLKPEAEKAFELLGKKIEWLKDEPGFVTPRIVSMIINEAFFALQEGVSTPDEINTAMKLGTAYPYGPFEWATKIGLQNIVTLLQKLSKEQSRYTPCELLVQETNKAI